MVPSVTTVLQRFKTDWAAQLQPDAIHTACQKAGYTSWRDRLLNPVITVGLDHGVGHPLLLLYDVKAPNGQKSNEFNDLNHYPSSTS
jgi:hypothetical protein